MTLSLVTNRAIDSGDVYSCARMTQMNVSVGVCQCQLGDITAFAMIQSSVTAVAKIPSEICMTC